MHNDDTRTAKDNFKTLDLKLGDDADWIKRLKSPSIQRFTVASRNPSIKSIDSDVSGKDETYILDTQTNTLRRIPGYNDYYYSILCPDGKHLYFLRDNKGNEIGHRCRIPIEGGQIEDMTPDLPDYSGYSIDFSNDSKTVVINAMHNDNNSIYCFELNDNYEIKERKMLYETNRLIGTVILSNDGNYIALSIAGEDTHLYNNLIIISTIDGSKATEIVYNKNENIDPYYFIQPTKILCKLSSDENDTVNIINIKTCEIENLPFDNIFDPHLVDLSTDRNKLLIDLSARAKQMIAIYDIEEKKSIYIKDISGMIWPAHIVQNEVYLLVNNSQSKSCL